MKKLSLHRETLQVLTPDSLPAVAGGGTVTDQTAGFCHTLRCATAGYGCVSLGCPGGGGGGTSGGRYLCTQPQ